MTLTEVYTVLMRMHQEIAALSTDEQLPVVADEIEDARLSLCEAIDFIAKAKALKWSIENLEVQFERSVLPC